MRPLFIALLIYCALVFPARAETIIIAPGQNIIFQQRGVNPRLYQLPSVRDLADRRFGEADLDGDNQLSRAEQKAFLARIADETRRASHTDLLATRQALRLRHYFHQSDRDKDGNLTRAEQQDYQSRLPYFGNDTGYSLIPAR
jgi:hypothetical protein